MEGAEKGKEMNCEGVGGKKKFRKGSGKGKQGGKEVKFESGNAVRTRRTGRVGLGTKMVRRVWGERNRKINGEGRGKFRNPHQRGGRRVGNS